MGYKYVNALYAFILSGGKFPAPEDMEDLDVLASVYIGSKQLISAVDEFMESDAGHQTMFVPRSQLPPESKPQKVVQLTCWKFPESDVKN